VKAQQICSEQEMECSKSCQRKWQIISYIIPFLASVIDLGTESAAYHNFWYKLTLGGLYDYRFIPNAIEAPTKTWLVGCILQGILCTSQLLLIFIFCYTMSRSNTDDEFSESLKYFSWWNKINYIIGFIFEDFMIGLAKFILATQSLHTLWLLQEGFTELLSSIVAFSVTFLQLIFTTATIIGIFRRPQSSKCLQAYGYMCVVLSSIALSMTMTVLIIFADVLPYNNGHYVGILFGTLFPLLGLFLLVVYLCKKFSVAERRT